MYPSLENKTISGAFFKPPIDTLPEKFFYATKDYCVEKEEMEKNVWLFILPFQKTKENEEQLNKYDLTILMEKSEIKFDDITGFSETIMSNTLSDNDYYYTVTDTNISNILLNNYNYSNYLYYKIPKDNIESYIDNFPTSDNPMILPDYFNGEYTSWEKEIINNILNNPGSSISVSACESITIKYKYFISKNGYLKIYFDGWLGLTDKGRSLITKAEEYFEDELDILGYKIRIIIPNTKEFWNIKIDFPEETRDYWFDFPNKPKKIFIETNNDGYNEYVFEEIPSTAAYVNFYNLETSQYDIKYLVEAETIWTDYESSGSKDNIYISDSNGVCCSGLVRLGNNLFPCIDQTFIFYKLETLDDSKKIITNFSNGIYQVAWMKKDKPYKVEYKTLDTEAKDKLYIEDDSNFYIAQWREE